MTSKKPAASKRANLPRASDYTKEFLKDWKRLSHSGRYNLNQLKEAMALLMANAGRFRQSGWIIHLAVNGRVIGLCRVNETKLRNAR